VFFQRDDGIGEGLVGAEGSEEGVGGGGGEVFEVGEPEDLRRAGVQHHSDLYRQIHS